MVGDKKGGFHKNPLATSPSMMYYVEGSHSYNESANNKNNWEEQAYVNSERKDTAAG